MRKKEEFSFFLDFLLFAYSEICWNFLTLFFFVSLKALKPFSLCCFFNALSRHELAIHEIFLL